MHSVNLGDKFVLSIDLVYLVLIAMQHQKLVSSGPCLHILVKTEKTRALKEILSHDRYEC